MVEIERIGPVLKLRLARSWLGLGAYFTAAYLVDGLMIDTGCAHTVRELLGALAGERIGRIVNTHSHEDHIAGNAALSARDGAPILAHPLALPVLAAPRARQPLHLYRLLFWGNPEPSRGTPLGESVESAHHRFEVLPTPGHSPDHVALFERSEGWLFGGDAFVGGRDRMLRPMSHIWQIIDSLRRMAALDPDLLFPGSGKVRQRPRAEILRKVEYLEELGARVRALHGRGHGVAEIRRRLLGPRHPLSFLTEGDFTEENLVRSYLEEPRP